MDLTIKGNPGTGNKYNDVRLGHAGSYNPAAKDVHHYYLAPEPAESRLSAWFRKLAEEFRNDERLRRKLDDIKRYKTVLDKTRGLDRKLEDGGFAPDSIATARRKKQYYVKKATKYQYYESAQRIDSYLYAKVCNRFDSYVFPLIRGQHPLDEVRTAAYEQVVIPILEEINEQGSADTCLCYTEDDIFGILYYLTGNCHINWTVYDLHAGI